MPVCEGKVRYRTLLDAKIALLRIDRGNEPQERRYYKCPRCRGWHLTKMEQNGDRDR
jgi:hypothetical protein